MEKNQKCFVCKVSIFSRTKQRTPKKYCSRACRQAAYRVREKTKREVSNLDRLLGVIAKAKEVLDPVYAEDLRLIHNVVKLHYTTVPFNAIDQTTWSNNRTPSIVAIYEYKDESNQLLYEVIRLKPKGFRQRRKDPKKPSKYLWNLGRVRRVLYRLPEICQAIIEQKVIFVVEGEKDADSLFSLGFVATTCPNGAMKWKREYSESLRNANVVIIPDNDLMGERHAKHVFDYLIGIAQKVRIVKLPDLPLKEDVTYWLENGGSKEKLLELVSQNAC